MPELKLYTVAQIREWLVNNKPAVKIITAQYSSANASLSLFNES